MRTAIRKHLGDFIAVLVLFTIAIAVTGYILENQRLRFPVIEEKPFQIKAEFSDAQAVLPGQGQTVRVAGVRVGDIAEVDLKDGRAIVTMSLDSEYERLVRADASALLRPKTGLKDMFMELDPGTKAAPLLRENGVIPVENTAPDIDQEEILSVLDSDTRAYLQLLVSGGGKGLAGRGDDLRATFSRLGPLTRDLARVTRAIAERRRNLARLVHNYGRLTNELADKDRELTTLVDASNAVFEAFASEDVNISAAVHKLPSALRQTEATLGKVDTLGRVLGPSLESLRPVFRRLDEANREVLPLAREATPILREQIRPFVRTAGPYIDDLAPAANDLADATPDLEASFHQLNRFFNMAAFNPSGAEALPGDLSQALNRDEGYLYWVAWIAQLTDSIFSTADASGPFRRALFSVSCETLRNSILEEEPALAPIIGVTNFLNDPGLCPKQAP